MKYADYRKYGHTRFTAFALSSDPLAWLAVSVVLGIMLGFSL